MAMQMGRAKVLIPSFNKDDGKFIIEKDDFYKKNIVNWTTPGDNSNNLLLDSALVDINNDGFDDLIAGFGNGNSGSLIFINSNGKFDENNYINIPEVNLWRKKSTAYGNSIK